MAVLNEDYGTAARDLIARFEGSTNFAKVTYLRGEADIAPAIDSRSVLMVLHLGPDFSRRLEGGMPAEVQLILDGRRSNAAQIVAGYAQAIFDRFERELAATRRTPPPPSVVTARIWFNPNLETTWNTVPALVAILTTLMGLVVTALSVARERELGTFEQLLVSPLDPHEIVIGKTVPALIIGLTEGTVMLLVGIFVFRVPFQGSFVLLYLAMTVFLAAVIGVGLFISSLATTQQQGILGAFVFMVPAILLSGFATPIENMPEWLQTLTLANPLRYYVAIIKGVFLKGMPAAIVVQLLWPLAVIALATLSAATWLFRHRVE
jgi:ABC-2 type transport system permease protein